MELSNLVAYLDDYLKIREIDDYGPQGLQVETEKTDIRRIALAVDTSPAVIDEAGKWDADLLIVHHGILWRSVEPIAGPLGRRVRMLMSFGINLYAAHLALDAHPDVGNNVTLAGMLGVKVDGWWCAPTGTPVGVYGETEAIGLDEFANRTDQRLDTQTRILAYGSDMVNKVAIISGAGADMVGEAKLLGVDTLLTGETSHSNYWEASDYGLNVLYAGHYATETVGVQALGQRLTAEFDLETRFLDFPTMM